MWKVINLQSRYVQTTIILTILVRYVQKDLIIHVEIDKNKESYNVEDDDQ